MKLLQTSFLAGITTVLKIVTSLIAGKIISIISGPSGIAIIGIFNNLVSVTSTLGVGAINNGVVKYTAEYQKESDKLKDLYNTVLSVLIVCSSIIGFVLLLTSKFISTLLFDNDGLSLLIKLLGLTIIFFSANSVILSILNGLGKINKYAIVNSIGSIISLITTLTLVLIFDLTGALYALLISQILIFIFSIRIFRKEVDFELKFKTSNGVLRNLSQYSLMAVITAFTIPLTQILIRNSLSSEISITAAGVWQGMIKISEGYLLVISTALSTYYLPKLSSIKTSKYLRAEIYKGYKIILPALFFICISIFLCRNWIIRILYTAEFMEMQKLFIWQLLGDFFKMSSYILAYLMIAKSRTVMYIITEVAFSISYILLAKLLIYEKGLEGVAMAFCLNYLIYLFTMLILFRKILLGESNAH